MSVVDADIDGHASTIEVSLKTPPYSSCSKLSLLLGACGGDTEVKTNCI